jgi:hypothetical protein
MKTGFFLVVLTFLSGLTAAHAFTQSFSAEAVQTAPGMQATHMKLFVLKDKAVRIEMTTPQGYFSDSGLMRVIYPARKEYIEQASPAPLSMPGEVVMNPCDTLPDAKCENMGEESINGMQAIHWKVVRHGPNQSEFTIEQIA